MVKYQYVSDPNLDLPKKPGVYWLVVLDCEFGSGGTPQPVPIGRLTRMDPYGILYIGSGANLADRAGSHMAEYLVKGHALIEGRKAWETTPWSTWTKEKKQRLLCFDYFHSNTVSSNFPLSRLAIVTESDTEILSSFGEEKLEQMLLYNYRQTFGELPPFNRQLSMRKWIAEANEDAQVGPLDMLKEPLGEKRYWRDALSKTVSLFPGLPTSSTV